MRASDTTALSGAVAYAYSDSVTMRIWNEKDPHQSSGKSSLGGSSGRSKKSMKNTLSGMTFDGMTIHDMDLLYEMLAQQAVNLGIIADTAALAKSIMLDSMKRSSTKLNDWKADMIKSGRTSLSIPMTEALIFKAEARLVSDAILTPLKKNPSDVSKSGRTGSPGAANIASRGRTSSHESLSRTGSALTSDQAAPSGAFTRVPSSSAGKPDSGHDAVMHGSMNLRRKYYFVEESDKEHSLVCVFRQRVVILDTHKTALAHHFDAIHSVRTDSNLLVLRLKDGSHTPQSGRQRSPPDNNHSPASANGPGFWSGAFSTSFVGRSRSISPQRSFKDLHTLSWKKVSALRQTASKDTEEVVAGRSDARCKSFSPERHPKRKGNTISQDKITSPYDVDTTESGGTREGEGGGAGIRGQRFTSPRGKWLRTSSARGSNDDIGRRAGDGDAEENLAEGEANKVEVKIVFRESASALAACREVSGLAEWRDT